MILCKFCGHQIRQYPVHEGALWVHYDGFAICLNNKSDDTWAVPMTESN